jgi:hypothetical protein
MLCTVIYCSVIIYTQSLMNSFVQLFDASVILITMASIDMRRFVHIVKLPQNIRTKPLHLPDGFAAPSTCHLPSNNPMNTCEELPSGRFLLRQAYPMFSSITSGCSIYFNSLTNLQRWPSIILSIFF